jgi:diguanylate cyclase (GGDEF)-like protein/PAS domain S-box-containing protein
MRNLKLTTVGLIFLAAVIAGGASLVVIDLVIDNNVKRVETEWETFQRDRSEKARLASVLRAAIGYGGMIHEFKNFVLRHDKARMDRVREHLGAATSVIEQYRPLGTSEAERVALRDIAGMIGDYADALIVAERLIDQGGGPREIDGAVKVDDTLALRGLAVLDREIAARVDETSRDVSESMHLAHEMSHIAVKVTVATIIFFIVAASWLIYAKVMFPIRKLTGDMYRLAQGDLDIEIENTDHGNEMGQMARSLAVFRETALKRREAEAALEVTNEELTRRLADAEDLKERLEEQAAEVVGMAEDLDLARAKAERAVREAERSEARIKAVVDTAVEGILTVDADGGINTVNPAAEKMFGYSGGGIIGMNANLLLSFGETDDKSRPLSFAEHVGDTRELHARRRDGTVFPAELAVGEMRLGDEVMYTGIVRDISERKEAEAIIEKLAMTDPLTGLANRNRFHDRLEHAIALSRRQGTMLVLLLVDLDRFKPVNDTYGYPVGDDLLKQVARTLTERRREVDTVARLGGDEFAIIAQDMASVEAAKTVGAGIVDDVSHPFRVGEHKIGIGASVGISINRGGALGPEEMIRQADAALYAVKNGGRNSRLCFDEMGGGNKSEDAGGDAVAALRQIS